MSNSTNGFLMDWGAPTVGAIFSSSLALGPMAAVLEARTAGNLGDVNPDVFPVLFVNCVAWGLYGKCTANNFIFAGNIPGMIFGMFYILSSYGLSVPAVRSKIEMVTLGFMLALVVTCFFSGILYKGNETMPIGIFANGIVFIVFSSPLSTLTKVVREGNSASINRPFGIIQVLNCITWTAYSMYIHDFYLLVPNIVGLVLGLVQCLLMLIFPIKKSSLKVDEDPNPNAPDRHLLSTVESTDSLSALISQPSVSPPQSRPEVII